MRIIRELVALEPVQTNGTNVRVALEYLNNVLKKRTITFLLSDFVSESYDKALQLAARKHDLVGLHVFDKADRELPMAGLVQVMDAEQGALQWIDTDDKNIRTQYAKAFDDHRQYCVRSFRKSGASLLTVRTDDDYVKVLQGFFKGR